MTTSPMRLQTVFAILVAILMTCVFAASTSPTKFNDGRDYDGNYYCAQIDELNGIAAPSTLTQQAPWCWRVLTPYVTSLLPGEAVEASTKLNLLLGPLCLFGIYLLICRFTKNKYLPLLGMILYGSNFWTLRFGFYSPCYTDMGTQFLTLCVLLALTNGYFTTLPFLLALSSFQKESFLFLTVVALTRYAQVTKVRWKIALYGALLLAPSVAVVLYLQSKVHPLNHYSSLTTIPLVLITQLLNPAAYPRILLELVSGGGMLLAIPLLAPSTARRFLKQEPIWAALLLVGAIQLFAGYDKGRLMLPMLPALLFTTIKIVDEWNSGDASRVTLWLVLCVVSQLFLSSAFSALDSHQHYLDLLVPIHSRDGLSVSFSLYATTLVLWLAATLVIRPWRGSPRS